MGTVLNAGNLTVVNEKIQRIIDQYSHLTTFADVEVWDSTAQELVADLTKQNDDTTREMERLNAVLQEIDRQYKSKPFVMRVLGGKGDGEIRKKIKALEDQAAALEKVGDDLTERIDLTPNSRADRDGMVAELKQLKKELQIEKREAKTVMSEIRADARNASAKVGYWASSRKYSASQRRSIRYQSERKLEPHETAVQAIDRQINTIDRRLIWLERYR